MQPESIPQKKFTGYWIPAELSKLGLSKIEQLLLSIIDALESDAPNYCFASNAYLAKEMDLSESRISFYLTKFKRMKLIKEVGFDGRRRRIRTLKENWYRHSENDPVSNKELCVKTGTRTTRKHEVSIRENAHHILKKDNIADKIIIADCENQPLKESLRLTGNQDPTVKEPDKPAGGNNKLSLELLEKCNDLSSTQKNQLCRYEPAVLKQAITYCYHPSVKLKGPAGRIKQLHAFCKDPELYADTMKTLEDPERGKTPKEKILSRFKRDNKYNGFEFSHDDIGAGMLHPNGIHIYSVNWNDTALEEKWTQLLVKLGIKNENGANDG